MNFDQKSSLWGALEPCLKHRYRNGLGCFWAHSLIDILPDEFQAYAQRVGLDITGTYCDVVVSGRKEGRPELNKLVKATRNYEFDYVLV